MNSMNITSLIPIILSSSLISALLTGFITWLIKRYDFKQEYYKELIKKRIECYENIEDFLGGFTVVGECEDGSRYYRCMENEESYMNVFIRDLGIATKFSMWVNSETCAILGKFNAFAIEYSKLIIGRHIDSPESEEEMIKIAVSHYKEIQKLKDKLRCNVIKDLKNLHKLDFKKIGF